MQKLYYSIGEVCQIVNEEQHILRYWEKEFDQLKPKKSRSGNRTYSEKDLNIIKTIKNFIREEKLSLKGAQEKLKRYLAEGKTAEPIVLNSEPQIISVPKPELSKNEIIFNIDDLNEIIAIMKESVLLLKNN